MTTTLERQKTLVAIKGSILTAIQNGKHSFAEIAGATNADKTRLMHEIEILENIYIFRVEPPHSTVTSWWLKKPKGDVVRGDDGQWRELPKPIITATRPIETQPEILPEENLSDEVREIPLELIVPNLLNPRGAVNTTEQRFLDLVESVKSVGIQQYPVVVRQSNGKFRLVIGHRRTEAARCAGLEKILCIVRFYPSVEAEEDAMLIENIQRKDLNPMQEARAFYRRYKALNKDIHALARALGLTQSTLTARMSLLKLDDSIQRLIEENRLSSGNGRILAQLEKSEQIKLSSRAVAMKGKDLKELVMQIKNREQGIKPPPKWEIKKRVTKDEEKFTRTWALKELDSLGATFYPAKFLRDSFDDVCQDACVERGNEAGCHACPIPRLVASLTRRTVRGEANG